MRIVVHASEFYPSRFMHLISSALLVGPKSTPQTSSFFPTVSNAGESHLSRDPVLFALRISRLGDRLPVTFHTGEIFSYQAI